MNKNNIKVDTATNGQTPKQDTNNVVVKIPTGKIITKEEKEKRRKAREEQFAKFRENALIRRAKRMGMTEEQIKEKVELLHKQIGAPNSYNVLLMFSPNNAKMLYAALDNEGIVCKMRGPVNYKEEQDSFCWVEADQETLATIREIAPPGTKIHPYVMKKPPILPITAPMAKSKKKTMGPKKVKSLRRMAKNGAYVAKNNDKSNTPKAIRNAKKAEEIRMHSDHKLAAKVQKEVRCKKNRKLEKAYKLFQKRLQKRFKKTSGTTIPMKPKKGSKATKKASTGLKQAA